MNYNVIFDSINAHPNADWSFCLEQIGAILAFVVMYVFFRPKKWLWARRFLLTICFLLALILIWKVGKPPPSIRDAFENPEKVETIEGVITNYEIQPKSEKFCVQQTCFQYYDYIVTGGFNNTAANGGPIKNGLNVRIRYIKTSLTKNTNFDNVILRLEVAQ